MINIICISVISAFIYLLVKKYCPEYSILIEISSVLLIFWITYPYLCDIIDFYTEFSELNNMDNDYIKIVLKTTGIAILSQFASDICRDSGENALAVKIEFAGKAIILSSAIPMVQALIQFATGLIK